MEAQISLKGMYRKALDGCPHRHGVKDSVDVCDRDEMRPCFYEVYHEPHEGLMGCEIFRDVICEWEEELEVKV